MVRLLDGFQSYGTSGGSAHSSVMVTSHALGMIYGGTLYGTVLPPRACIIGTGGIKIERPLYSDAMVPTPQQYVCTAEHVVLGEATTLYPRRPASPRRSTTLYTWSAFVDGESRGG